MQPTVRISSPPSSAGALDEADMLDPFAEMPDGKGASAPLAAESTQILAEADLETLDDRPSAPASEPVDASADETEGEGRDFEGTSTAEVDPSERDSVEVRIDDLDDDEADAVVQAAIASGAIPPPSVPDRPSHAPPRPGSPTSPSPTGTVPGVARTDLDQVGFVDEPDDDEPELTVSEPDEMDLGDELEELDEDLDEFHDDLDDLDDELDELDDDAIEEAEPLAAAPSKSVEKPTPPAPPASVEKPAPPAPPPSKPDVPKPPVVPEAKKKRRKAWFEGFFSDDYLRTVRPPTPREVSRECDFIIGQLGLPRGATILDVGCGLGLHAIELTRRGYLVVGLDLSLPMLSRAGNEAQDEGLRINFLHGDMRQMAFEGQFDAVLCWGTTFGYFDDEGNHEVVQRLFEALKPKGLLLLNIVNRDRVITEQPNLVWFEGDGCVCMEESRFDYLRSRLHVKRTVILDDGRQRENTYSIRLYSAHEIGKMLHATGFRVAKLSGMKATPGVFFGVASPELIFLAERRAEMPSGSKETKAGRSDEAFERTDAANAKADEAKAAKATDVAESAPEPATSPGAEAAPGTEAAPDTASTPPAEAEPSAVVSKPPAERSPGDSPEPGDDSKS